MFLRLGLAEIGDRQVEPRSHLTVRVFGKADRAGLGDAFQPGGDIDSVAHQVAVALFDNVADMDADAELDATLRRQPALRSTMPRLHLDRAAHRVDSAAEFDQRSVAGALDDATVMHGDCRVDEIAAQGPQSSQRPILVRARQTAVARRRRLQELPPVSSTWPCPCSLSSKAWPTRPRFRNEEAGAVATRRISSLCGGNSPARIRNSARPLAGVADSFRSRRGSALRPACGEKVAGVSRPDEGRRGPPRIAFAPAPHLALRACPLPASGARG